MLLTVSMLLFSLVAMELFAIIRKSIEEGQAAFLSPLLMSSKQHVLYEKLEQLLNRQDAKGISTLLKDARIMKEAGHGVSNLENLEVAMAEGLESNYNRFLQYLPDDLKDFFESYRILWDVKNLKLLMSCALERTNPEQYAHLTRPFGYLDSRSIELLSKSYLPEGVVENALNFLPTEFSPNIRPENRYSTNELEFSLDIAAFEYLRQKSEEIGTQKTRLLWEFLITRYEVENIVTIARLKCFKGNSEDIKRFLFPSWKLLNETDQRRLLDAEDYSTFLLTLRETPYGKYVPAKTVDPMEFEWALKRKVGNIELKETKLDFTIEKTIRFLLELEQRCDIMRKAAYFAMIKRSDEA